MAFVTVCGSSSFTPRVTLQRTTCLRRARFTTRASIEREVSEELKVAMKARDSERVKALRTIRAAFLTALKAEGAGDSLSDREAVASLRKLAKMREESIEMFRKGGRDDLVQAEQAELAVIEHWLPSMASEEQVTIWVKDAISKTGASKPGDMGKVMGYVIVILQMKLPSIVASSFCLFYVLNILLIFGTNLCFLFYFFFIYFYFFCLSMAIAHFLHMLFERFTGQL